MPGFDSPGHAAPGTTFHLEADDGSTFAQDVVEIVSQAHSVDAPKLEDGVEYGGGLNIRVPIQFGVRSSNT